ncbi:ABC transporter substrate-binding protein [Salinibacterium sp. M195]|uniref:ABC transporter substrate-binding protein n=1 Tax=Salinibacterium sp. M195 TaxID=2583374 RepID=UPI002106C0C1|nr:ABC transporter substrate-binding protein [Salinibacterium sp. M195]QYH34988.1 ABC transporter substrate-binding protein [Salinibacterium sp. M195]
MSTPPALKKSRRISVALLVATALTLSACTTAEGGPSSTPNTDALISQKSCDRNAAAGTITYISGYGYSASAGQLDVFLAEELGYFDDLCLDVEINASGANGQQLVSSGQAEFTALGSASDVMLAAANSGNLTAVATYGNTPPFSIFANEKITDLTDLEGGTLGYFINLTPIASAMLDAAGVDMSKVELIKMTNYDPTVVTRGQVDAIVGYASNQPENLRAQGLPFTEFFPADFGVGGTYNVMEVNSQFLAQNRAVSADFMRATLHALQFCLDSSDECLDILAGLADESGQGAAFPRDQLERTWNVESQWVRDSNSGLPGTQTAADWQPEYELVTQFGGVDNVPAITAMIDQTLVADLYADGALIWPGN